MKWPVLALALFGTVPRDAATDKPPKRCFTNIFHIAGSTNEVVGHLGDLSSKLSTTTASIASFASRLRSSFAVLGPLGPRVFAVSLRLFFLPIFRSTGRDVQINEYEAASRAKVGREKIVKKLASGLKHTSNASSSVSHHDIQPTRKPRSTQSSHTLPY